MEGLRRSLRIRSRDRGCLLDSLPPDILTLVLIEASKATEAGYTGVPTLSFKAISTTSKVFLCMFALSKLADSQPFLT